MRQELFDGLHVWWLPVGLLIAVSSAWWSSQRISTQLVGVCRTNCLVLGDKRPAGFHVRWDGQR